MTSISIIIATGEKKWMPMKRFGSLNSAASEVIGSVEVLEAKMASSPMTAWILAMTSDFTLRSSNTASMIEIAVRQRGIVGRRRDLLQQRVALGALHAAFHDAVGQRLVQRRLALVGGFLIAIDQHHRKARSGAHLRNAGAHEAGADDADLLELGRRLVGRTARALVQVLHVDEQRADHRRRFRRAQDLGEPARLDAQRGVHRHLQAFIDDLQDGARGRVVVVGLAAIDRVRRREGHHAGLGIDEPAGQLEALHIPRRFAPCRRP